MYGAGSLFHLLAMADFVRGTYNIKVIECVEDAFSSSRSDGSSSKCSNSCKSSKISSNNNDYNDDDYQSSSCSLTELEVLSMLPNFKLLTKLSTKIENMNNSDIIGPQCR